MPVIPEESIPNITIQVATPPLLPPLPPSPQETLEPTWFAYSGTYPVREDNTSSLLKLIEKKDHLRETLLKTYNLSQVSAVSPPPPPSPPPALGIFSTAVDFLVENLPGLGITYKKGDARSFDNTPSGVFIGPTNSIISTPYFPKDPNRLRNGVLNNSKNVNPSDTTYLWESLEELTDPRTGLNYNVLQPRPDGAVEMTPQPRVAKVPRKSIKLTPHVFESAVSINNGKKLNAFALMLGIVPGCSDATNNPRPWRLTLEFGEITLSIDEGKPEVEVYIHGHDTVKVTVNPGAGGITTHHFGERPYCLTFIPVWNGILISDHPPGSPNWPDKVTLVKKNPNRSMVEEVNKILWPEEDRSEAKKVPMELPTLNNGAPKDDQTPAIIIPTDLETTVDTGETLRVTYFRCGGMLKFIPVYFPEGLRTHVLNRGTIEPVEVDINDLVTPAPPSPPGVPPVPTPPPPPPPPPPQPDSEDVFKLDSASDVKILPVFYYPNYHDLEIRTTLAKLPTGDNTPYNDSVVDYKRKEPDFRLPIETWGFLTYKKEESYFQFNNDDGFLTVNDVPEPRIRSLTVSRSLDGSSGSITWDRYDPLTGLFTRPPQNAGGIQIGITGGVDTLPGIIFTGLAIGNSESDQSSSNEINIPLHGREAKLTEEGALRLINVPFFDGWDHVEVMKFLCNYGGVPLRNMAEPYRLPSSFNIQEPIVNFTTGTPVWSAMSELSRLAGTLFYFDRFGDLVYLEVAKTTGINWTYPDAHIVNYDDEPDFSTLRNHIVLSALVSDGKFPDLDEKEQFHNLQMTSPVLMSIRLNTTPNFAWDKMMFYAINGVLPTQAEFNRVAIQISKGVARPRATGKVTIPGNAKIDLLDIFNDNWIITNISHTVDVQSKRWTTNLSLELLVDPVLSGTATILPVANIG
jgi:hypothetical protein